jgi:hypothetical protein
MMLAAATGRATTLWYDGDGSSTPGGGGGTANEEDTSASQSNIYDDFIVPAGQTWTISSVFSNDLMNFTGITSADWEIREGLSAGNSGTLLASGTSTASQTATGRTGTSPFIEYTIQVNSLDVVLTAGTYWLTVAPIGSGSGNSYMSFSVGTNAVGSSTANDAFWNSSTFGKTYSAEAVNYSEGVLGTASVPEPGSLALGGSGLLLLVAAGVRRFTSSQH